MTRVAPVTTWEEPDRRRAASRGVALYPTFADGAWYFSDDPDHQEGSLIELDGNLYVTEGVVAGSRTVALGQAGRVTPILLPEYTTGAYDFTRTSAATYVTITGLLKSAASGELRDAHYLTDNTGTLRRVTLLERAGVNGWSAPEDLSNAAWLKYQANVGGSITRGDLTLKKLIENTTGGQHDIRRTYPGATDNTTQSATFYAVADEKEWCAFVAFQKDASTVCRAYFHLSGDGAVGTTSNMVDARITALGEGLYEIEVRWNSGSGATSSPMAFFRLATGDGGEAYTGDGSSGLYLGGFQFEADAAVPSSYMGTTPRVADDFTRPLLDSTPQEATYLYEGVVLDLPNTGSAHVLFNVGESAGANRLQGFLPGAASRVHLLLQNASSTKQAYWNTPALALGDHVSIRLYVSGSGDFTGGLSINGGAEDTTFDSEDANIALPGSWANNVVRFSSDNGATDANSGLISFKAQSGSEKTLAEMQALTSPDIAHYRPGLPVLVAA